MSQQVDAPTARFLGAVCANMPFGISSEVMEGWIENPNALRAALRRALCPPPDQYVPRAWKRIDLAAKLDGVSSFFEALNRAGINIQYFAKEILDNTPVIGSGAKSKKEVVLVRVSGEELGFETPASYELIIERAVGRGLRCCPPQVAPQLRLQYMDQSQGEVLIVATEFVSPLCLLIVEQNKEGARLDCSPKLPSSHRFHPESQFVFVLPPL